MEKYTSISPEISPSVASMEKQAIWHWDWLVARGWLYRQCDGAWLAGSGRVDSEWHAGAGGSIVLPRIGLLLTLQACTAPLHSVRQCLQRIVSWRQGWDQHGTSEGVSHTLGTTHDVHLHQSIDNMIKLWQQLLRVYILVVKKSPKSCD